MNHRISTYTLLGLLLLVILLSVLGADRENLHIVASDHTEAYYLYVNGTLILQNDGTQTCNSTNAGALYYSTDTDHYACNGTAWNSITSGGGGSGDVTDVLAGNGITVTDSAGPQPSVAINAVSCTTGNYSWWNGSHWGCRPDTGAGAFTDTNVTTACSGNDLLQGDGDCVATPVDTDTNVTTVCSGNDILQGDGDCVLTPTDSDSWWTHNNTDFRNSSTILHLNHTTLQGLYLDDTTIGNCSADGSCGLIHYDSEVTPHTTTLPLTNITGTSDADSNCSGTDQVTDVGVTLTNGVLSVNTQCSAQGSGGGMTEWTAGNGSATATITEAEQVNWTAGTGITITLLGNLFQINTTVVDTTIGNCSGDNSCSAIHYDSEVTPHTVNCSADGSCGLLHYDSEVTPHTVNCSAEGSCGLIAYDSELVDTNVTTACSGNNVLQGDGDCVPLTGTDTNETVRFTNLTAWDCGGTDKVTGVAANGTLLCGTDETGAASGVENNTGGWNVSFRNLTSEYILLPLGDALHFGDRDTTIYEQADDILRISVGAVGDLYEIDLAGIATTGISGGPQLRAEQATSTNPNLLPNQDDVNSGVGQNDADQLSLIAGGWEGIRITEAATDTVAIYGGTTLSGGDLTVQEDLSAMNGTFTRLNVTDWGNVTLSESQITDLTHTVNCSADGSCGLIHYDSEVTAHTVNCSASGSCGGVAYLDYANTGMLNITGNFTTTGGYVCLTASCTSYIGHNGSGVVIV